MKNYYNIKTKDYIRKKYNVENIHKNKYERQDLYKKTAQWMKIQMRIIK